MRPSRNLPLVESMYIRSLSLRQFRIFNRLELDLSPATILLLGANAQGKTSLLEALAYLAVGRSPLTHVEQHLIHWDAAMLGMPFAHLEAEVVRRDRTEQIAIAVERKTLSNGQARLQKRITINRHKVKRAELAGHLNVVLFLPEDVGLVGGPPTLRRRHLDDLLAQVYPAYIEAVNRYQTALSRRNALLRHLRDRGGDWRQLEPLELTLAETGVTLSLYRQGVVNALNLYVDPLHRELTGNLAWLKLHYLPSFNPHRPPDLAYQPSLMPEDVPTMADAETLRESYRQVLVQRRPQAIERGMTLVGPHRDEVRFISLERDVGIFGSRGQQRTAVLALRLAELRWLEQVTGESPVLLLDEVLAELDRARRGYLLSLLPHVEQAILATTDAEMFPPEFRRQAHLLTVNEGIIAPVVHPVAER